MVLNVISTSATDATVNCTAAAGDRCVTTWLWAASAGFTGVPAMATSTTTCWLAANRSWLAANGRWFTNGRAGSWAASLLVPTVSTVLTATGVTTVNLLRATGSTTDAYVSAEQTRFSFYGIHGGKSAKYHHQGGSNHHYTFHFFFPPLGHKIRTATGNISRR